MATLARLMPGLPQYVDPLRLAETEESIAGQLPVSAMPRLREVLGDDSGAVEFRVQFRRDEQGRVRILGEFSASLHTVCQRCLDPLVLVLTGPIDVTPVNPETASPVAPAEAEPLLLTDGRIHVGGFIEDEVLLALPIAPAHRRGKCVQRSGTAPDGRDYVHPFAALKGLNVRKD